MMRRPPRSTLWPCTTLVRSTLLLFGHRGVGEDRADLVVVVGEGCRHMQLHDPRGLAARIPQGVQHAARLDRQSTRLNSSHANISYAVFCLTRPTHSSPPLMV